MPIRTIPRANPKIPSAWFQTELPHKMTSNEPQIGCVNPAASQALTGLISAGPDGVWEGVLACPACAIALKQDRGTLSCGPCRKQWPIRGGIPAFVDRFPYWGEIPLAPMRKVNSLVQREYWKTV